MPETENKLSNLDTALHYAAAWGWRVFPVHSVGADGFCTCGLTDNCSSPAKHPVGSLAPQGVNNATTDEKQIRAWWGEFGMPDANIGIATGGESNLVVVDLDIEKGANINYLNEITLNDIVLKESIQVQTGGGLHFYYALPTGVEIKNSANRLGKFIDVRGEGGYVVAPPSKHISGRDYKFINPEIETLLEFPDEWLAKLAGPKQPENNAAANGNSNGLFVAPPQATFVVPDRIAHGARNDSLTRIAGSLRRLDLTQSEIENTLWSVNARVCQPPLDTGEVQKLLIRSRVTPPARRSKTRRTTKTKVISRIRSSRIFSPIF